MHANTYSVSTLYTHLVHTSTDYSYSPESLEMKMNQNLMTSILNKVVVSSALIKLMVLTLLIKIFQQTNQVNKHFEHRF